MKEGLAVGITIFVINLLGYPIARKRRPENRFLEPLTFWRWVVYSVIVVVATLALVIPIRMLMDHPPWLVLLLLVGIGLSSWTQWRFLTSGKK